ncbi:hypothetical protein COV16_02395 [Candidatus Woesearchaeota archaeon CG10_big_fil_rev_8_21_14_0_10_34_8]|nr:MAG: hypothetical protein COV16_02395 [Candidatus Woesearchaeota archaeon CG10_big_fil_rev_8_21_14_0_10_34_8]
MLSIIVTEIEHAQNLGAICRAMANFGFKDLILINPKCKPDNFDALIRAKHSSAPILKNAKIKDFDVLKKFDILIGTTARNGTRYNIPRAPLTPVELALILEERGIVEDPKVRAGLLIGREGHGLDNEEIKKCDFIVTIPTHEGYIPLNISHAVSILLYEIYKKLGTSKFDKKFHKSSAKDKEIILGLIDEILAKMEFKSESKRETQKIVWKRMVGKSLMTKREAFALIGFLKKLK